MRINPLLPGLLLGLSLTGLAVAACSNDDDNSSSSSNGQTIAVTLTDDGCTPAKIDAKAGSATFVVTNKGADGVTEFEILSGDRILGEVENIIDGLTGRFSLNLDPGDYTTYCPGAKTDKGTLHVTGTATTAAREDADLDAAVATYRAYIEDNTRPLVTATQALADAITKGDVADARAKYILARPYYERVEPVAEAFGDLDPAIDARADDVPIEQVTGFHRIEYMLWEKNSTDGMKPIADQLVKDVTRLRDESPTLELDALQIANGANELLGEVSASKVTGEEERYSHIDLVDFQANVEGSRAAFNAVRAALDKRDQTLATTVDSRFDAVETALKAYQKNGTFVSYTELTPDDTLKLSQLIDALAEPLSEVAAKLAEAPTK